MLSLQKRCAQPEAALRRNYKKQQPCVVTQGCIFIDLRIADGAYTVFTVFLTQRQIPQDTFADV